jgi:mRNA interferase MazF
VWWYEHPQAGRRPFLVLTRDEVIPWLNQVLAAPITRAVRGVPTEVELDRDDGMPTTFVVSLDNVTPVRPALLTELSAKRMQAVCDALGHATACQ